MINWYLRHHCWIRDYDKRRQTALSSQWTAWHEKPSALFFLRWKYTSTPEILSKNNNFCIAQMKIPIILLPFISPRSEQKVTECSYLLFCEWFVNSFSKKTHRKKVMVERWKWKISNTGRSRSEKVIYSVSFIMIRHVCTVCLLKNGINSFSFLKPNYKERTKIFWFKFIWWEIYFHFTKPDDRSDKTI